MTSRERAYNTLKKLFHQVATEEQKITLAELLSLQMTDSATDFMLRVCWDYYERQETT